MENKNKVNINSLSSNKSLEVPNTIQKNLSEQISEKKNVENMQKNDSLCRLNTLIRKAGVVIGIKLDPFEAVVERTLNRLLCIMDNPTPPLHLQLGRQELLLRCHKD